MEILEKLSKIQAIIERTSSEGERQAAVLAMERLLQQQKQQPKEYRITLRSIWQKNLFVAICWGVTFEGFLGCFFEFELLRFSTQNFPTTRIMYDE
jgi:hypothetical protein